MELLADYLDTALTQAEASDFSSLEKALKEVTGAYDDEELNTLSETVIADIEQLKTEAVKAKTTTWDGRGRDIDDLKAAAEAFAPTADRIKALTKEIDHFYKLATRVHDEDVAAGTKPAEGKKRLNVFDEARHEMIEHLKRARYFHTQADWLLTRFPYGELCDVEGLVKLVDRDEIEASDWSLTPGRYVGVAPEEEDEDFDFDEALRDIHIEIDGLNEEAAELAEIIKKNFEELIV